MRALKPDEHKPALITYADLHGFTSRWTWPTATASARDIFSPKHSTSHWSHGSLQCTASECLSIIPVMRSYFHIVASTPIGERFHHEIASFISVCDAVETLQYTSRMHIAPQLLEDRIFKHLTNYQLAYGTVGWVWKHHASIHLASQMKRHGTLYSCFTHERRHKLIRKYTNDRKTLVSYDLGVVEDCLVQQLHDTRVVDVLRTGLIDARDPSQNKLKAIQAIEGDNLLNTEIKSSILLSINAARIKRGDVVIMETSHVDIPLDAKSPMNVCFAELWFIYSLDHAPKACVSIWKYISYARGLAKVQMRESVLVSISANLIKCSVVYKRSHNEMCTISVPPPYQ
jgi:hypothetical protein